MMNRPSWLWPLALVLWTLLSAATMASEEDIKLTTQIIIDHAAWSSTARKEQFIEQMKDSAEMEDVVELVDISIPYHTAAQLAFEVPSDTVWSECHGRSGCEAKKE